MKDAKRVSGTLRFSEVTQCNQLADFLELAQHHDFGNIAHWVPATQGGTTYISLVRGYIAITAARVEMIDG